MHINPLVASQYYQDLCTGCGTCVGICPSQCIKMTKDSKTGVYLPLLADPENCTRCGLCADVCPGESLDFTQLNLSTFGRVSDDKLIGNSVGLFVGHATDNAIRCSSTSGGIATSLLLNALDSGAIDGAIVTKMSEANPLEPAAFIATNKQEILSAMGSKYCPTALNTILSEVRNTHGRLAIVGLPCHIHGLRKCELISNQLRKKIVLQIGLFCSHEVSFNGTQFLLKSIGITPSNVASLSYRGKGWPGYMTIETKDHGVTQIPFFSYWNRLFSYPLFIPRRCMFCPDATSELADISLGDAWSRKGSSGTGESILVVRSEAGRHFVQEAMRTGVIELNAIDRSEVLSSQEGCLTFKKRKLSARLHISKLLRRNTPTLAVALQKPHLSDYLGATLNHLITHSTIPRYICTVYLQTLSFRHAGKLGKEGKKATA